MKKWIAVLLAVILLGSSFAVAEEQQGDFLQSLGQWVQSLNLETSDYMGSVEVDGNQAFTATLRQDGGITELAVPGLGRAQLSGTSLLLELEGHEKPIDLSAPLMWIMTMVQGNNPFQKGTELIMPWLQKAYTDILLPCVQISYDYSGTVIHIEATDETIRERVYAFVDEFMAERKTAETLLSSCAPLLSKLIPGMPKTFEELEQAWQMTKERGARGWTPFGISADITCAQRYNRLAVTGRAELYFSRMFTGNLSFELVTGGDGEADLLVSFDMTDYKRYNRDAYRLEFHCRDNTARAVLEGQGNTIILTWEQKTGEDRRVYVTGGLTAQNTEAGVYLKYDLDAVYDPENFSLTAELYETWRPGTPDETRKRLAALEMTRGVSSVDALLTLPNDTLSLHISSGDQYTRVRLNHTGASRYLDWYADAWVYHTRDENKIMLDTDIFEHRPCTYSLTLRKNALELEWRREGLEVLSASAQLDLGANGEFNRLDVAATLYDRTYAGHNRTYKLMVIPGMIVYEDDTGNYSLGISENTAEKMTIRLMKEHAFELGRLELTLDTQGAFNGALKVLGKEIGRLVFKPIPKEPVRAIGETE